MPKVSQQYWDARRERVLAAARRCFVRKGFHATSMQDLFTESGLSSGAVYRYFPSKDEMVVAIAQDNLRGIIAMIHDVAGQQPDRPVGDVLADVFEVIRAKHAEGGLASLALLVWAEAAHTPALATQFGALIGQLRHDLAAIVAAQQQRGQLPSGVAPAALAGVLLATIPGYILQLALNGPADVQDLPAAARALWTATPSRRHGDGPPPAT
jgi:AcrR family transcriptional regulator